MIFFSRKPKPTTLPPGWPSPYHNKCSQRDCIFPNSPQTVKGVYPCRGVPGGFYCEGTYKISSSRAQDTERYLKEAYMARRTAEEEQRKRTTSEMRRPDPTMRRRARDVPSPDSGLSSHVAADDRRRAVYRTPSRASHVPHSSSRPSDVGRPPQLPHRHPSYTAHRPASSQVEAEFITDQIMMHLYPERKIQPRW
ncbi:hypothetical protein OG21DRAFT_1522821 [Imleria badia]|nr:hypothetical protein OG21DRAFT_1522821 [Imleria badia]